MRLPLLVLLLAAAAPAGETPPAQAVSGETALTEGVRWLVENQNEDGSWGTHRTRRVRGIWCDVPGGHQAFRVGTSGLATRALRSLTAAHRTKETEAAASRGLAYLARTGPVKRSQPAQIYNVWALAYSLWAQAEALLEPRDGEDLKAVRRSAEGLVAELVKIQFLNGGWGYFDFRARTLRPSGDAMSFTTATCLLALHRAREAGIDLPEKSLRKALSCLKRCRNPDGSWIYSLDHEYHPRGLINRPKGSLSRTPACATALHLFTKRPGLDEVRKGLRRLVTHHRFAKAGVRKPIPHESWYAVSGYFYLYGYAYAGLAVELLPEAERAEYREPFIRAVLETRHPDGCFWDYPLYDYHKPYGTAYAVLALDRLTRIPAPR